MADCLHPNHSVANSAHPIEVGGGTEHQDTANEGGRGANMLKNLKVRSNSSEKEAFSSLQSPSNFPFFLVLPLLLDCSSTYFVEVLLIHL
jgi:hypothetical protein